MRSLLLSLFFLGALAGSAAAGTPVPMDADEVDSRLRNLQEHINALRTQLSSVPGGSASSMMSRVDQIQGQVTGLERMLRRAQNADPGRPPAPPAPAPNAPPPPRPMPPAPPGPSRPNPPPPPTSPATRAIDEASLSALLKEMSSAPFPADKLRLVDQAIASNYFLVDQVVRMLQGFSFDDDKLRCLENVKPRLLDIPQNGSKIYGLFTFSSGKARAKAILGL